MGFERRNVVTYVLLSIVTCGIFMIYWFYQIGSDLYRLNGLESKAGIDILLSIVTCGIYFIYLQYKWGKMVDSARRRYDLYPRDDALLFVILTILSLSIVNYCIIQTQINEDFIPVIESSAPFPMPESEDDRSN